MERSSWKPGTVLRERYIIECTIGAGGFGTTYRAWDPVLDVTVAIKEYRKGTERFLREARIMARFRSCRNIVYVYDFFEVGGAACIVMEFLEGETLKDRIERSGRIPPKEAARILIPVLKALETVHRAGVIHKDVAPDNIFLLKNGRVKLFDFGNAFEQGDAAPGIMAVKNGYSPPEQYRPDRMPRPEYDIYAAGATLYRMITAEIPPPAADRERDPLLGFGPDGKRAADRRLMAVIRKAMQPVPGKRYPGAAVFRRELERYLKRYRILPAAAVLAGALAFVLLWVSNPEEESIPETAGTETAGTETAGTETAGTETAKSTEKKAAGVEGKTEKELPESDMENQTEELPEIPAGEDGTADEQPGAAPREAAAETEKEDPSEAEKENTAETEKDRSAEAEKGHAEEPEKEHSAKTGREHTARAEEERIREPSAGNPEKPAEETGGTAEEKTAEEDMPEDKTEFYEEKSSEAAGEESTLPAPERGSEGIWFIPDLR